MEKEYDYSDANLIYTVSELTLLLKETIETKFYAVWIKGEISALKNNYASGYYFDLKDENAKISCIIFKYDIKRIHFEIQEGISVRAFGRINLYEPRGSYSFIITDLEPEGYGQFALAFEQLKKKLETEGLFEESRKRKIPFLPETVGIVTSRSGAVLYDIIKVITSRFENIHIIFVNATVQGPNSSKEIADAIYVLNQYNAEHCKIDVMIVGRGGGSIEDLWAFNEEITAYAIFNSKIPVISAVGHETDFTIADFVSDRRASTPSNAAETVVPVKFDIINKVKGLEGRLERVIFNKINQLLLALKNLTDRQKIKMPLVLIQNKYRMIDDLIYDLSKSVERKIKTFMNSVIELNKRFELRHPSNIIKDRINHVNEINKRLWLHHPSNIIKDRTALIEKLSIDFRKSTFYLLLIYKHKLEALIYKIQKYDQGNRIYANRKIIDNYQSNLLNFIVESINTKKAVIKNQNEKLNDIVNLKLSKYKNGVNLYSNTLYSLSPYAVLKRGYSIVFSQKKEVVSKISKVNKNENITIAVSDGSIDALVLSKSKNKTNI